MGVLGARRRRRQEREYNLALSRWRSFDDKWTTARDKLLEAREAGTTKGVGVIGASYVQMELRESPGHNLVGTCFITLDNVQVYPMGVTHPSGGFGRLIMEWTFGPRTHLTFNRWNTVVEFLVDGDPAASSLVLRGGENMFYCHIGDVTSRLGIQGALEYVTAEQAKHAAAKPELADI